MSTMPPEWEEVPEDPDPESDLGYEMADLVMFETQDDTDQVMFLEGHEELLEGAFVVVSRDDVRDVTDRV